MDPCFLLRQYEFGNRDPRNDSTARILTPLLIHRKLPVTARTAGRRDRPEAPTATPAFILLFFSSSEKWPEDENPLSAFSGTAAKIRSGDFGRGRNPASSVIGPHRGSHGPDRGCSCICSHSI